jgi:hypothetical protein
LGTRGLVKAIKAGERGEGGVNRDEEERGKEDAMDIVAQVKEMLAEDPFWGRFIAAI